MENPLNNLIEKTLPEIQLCYGCSRLKLAKDIHGQASLISDSKTQSKSRLNSITSGQTYNRNYTTDSINLTIEDITLCNKCWEALEEGVGIKDPSIPEQDEIHIDSYKPII